VRFSPRLRVEVKSSTDTVPVRFPLYTVNFEGYLFYYYFSLTAELSSPAKTVSCMFETGMDFDFDISIG
jgi:hypothetical protein